MRVVIGNLDRFDLSVEEVTRMQHLFNNAATNSQIDERLIASNKTTNNFQCLITMYGSYKEVSTYRCLGFSTLFDQWSFAQAYCNPQELGAFTDKVSRDSDLATLLTQFIVKLRNNLLLNGYSPDEVNRCSDIILYKQIASSSDPTEGMQSIRNITSAMNSEIQTKFVGNTTEVVNNDTTTQSSITSVNPEHRHRHHHRIKNDTAQQRHRRAIDKETVASSASKPKSWINTIVADAINAITGGVASVKNLISKTLLSSPLQRDGESSKSIENAVGFHDKFLGKLSEPRVQKLCEGLKAHFNKYKDSDINTCKRSVAEFVKDQCSASSDGSSGLCADKLLGQFEETIDRVQQYNSRELAKDFFNQDGNIQLLTYLIKWYWKIKSKDEDEKDVHDKIREAACEVLKEVEVCKVISKAISLSINISVDDIYSSALGMVIINKNSTKEEISEVLFSALEHLSEIKLEESKEEESRAITSFIKECEGSILDIVVQSIINNNQKLSTEERSYNMALCNELGQKSTKAQPMQLGLIYQSSKTPISSLSSTQVTNVNAHSKLGSAQQFMI